MSMSANTLFHFTNNASNLIGILENGFYPRFCLEEKTTIIDVDIAIPMICFCDIPLSAVSNHISFYGNYGIGMTKDWALKKGINPVMYMSSSSSLSKHFDEIMKTYIKFMIGIENGGVSKDNSIRFVDFKNIIEVKGYAKPIKGKMFRNNAFIDKYFYDEREWRYVSTIKEYYSAEPRLSKDEFLDPIKLAQANSELSKQDQLTFEIDDVKYLIIDKESEISSMISSIKKIFKKFGENKIEILSSKIITSKQIQEDF